MFLRILFPESVSWRFAANFVQLHKNENPASGKRQLALSGVPDLMELAAAKQSQAVAYFSSISCVVHPAHERGTCAN